MRYYHLPPAAEKEPPTVGDEVALPAGESRHLLKVMRARAGDEVLLTDGRGRRLTATLLRAHGPAARLRIEASELDRAELLRPRLWLACSVVKGRHFEWALEKAVELGAHAIQPLLTARGEIAPREGKLERWGAILAGAAKQSGRAWLPDLSPPANLSDWLSVWRGGGLYYGVARARDRNWRDDEAGLLSPGRLFASAGGAIAVAGDLAWVVGPEGGWDERELAALAGAGTPVRLGPHRLRTETAACAGLALLAAVREMLLDAEPAPGA
ncbi:16S rRNA (uracil(1498)-N(3))-methyltransferase [bacterium]|nr:16S rRNA (uracil(1498)-N(3))-methyltransferase [bacterium]MBU1073965.1 16S rRNA (uracil(1498)-N(3))-methyltransferase [bacterium]MBU1674859.1 16S rRNA (uracil(1498)-N(3))-methyltransferase [bacterium]